MITEEQFKIRDDSMRKTGFEMFMATPTVRLLISMIPASDRQETLTTLLEEAYTNGWTNGSGAMTMHMLESFMKRGKDFR